MLRDDSDSLPTITREEDGLLVLLGPGVVDGLDDRLRGLGWRRVYLVTGRSLASGPVGEQVIGALGPIHVGTYPRARPHVPTETVEEAAQEARAADVDAIVGLGGGSPIGTAKAVAYRLKAGPKEAGPAVVAIPTTYAGSEVTPIFGTTDLVRGQKRVIRDPAVRPRLALYDPVLARETPAELTASTAMNALAHCVEGLYSPTAGPREREMALRAAVLIRQHLPLCLRDPRSLHHRYRMFEGSLEAGLVLARAGMGVHHGVCHILGGRYDLPHGVLNAIVLPHAMRFNLGAAREAYRALADAFGLPVKGVDAEGIGKAVCRTVEDLVAGLGLPLRLRDLGIPRDELPAAAQEALRSAAVGANPRPVRDADDVLEILQAAW